jgi:predicted esterase
MEPASEHFLTVTKTARVYSVGTPGKHITEVWLVLHGYAQLASPFLEPFSAVSEPHRLIIAPEALNHFYAKGFGGKPAASWMTSEMREHEIFDYIHYLNRVCETFVPANCKLVLLGFSQGVATASRWLNQTIIPVSSFIIHSGELATELVKGDASPALVNTPLVYITGTNDPLINPEKHEIVKALMHRLHARFIEFDGGHEVKGDVLAKLKDLV